MSGESQDKGVILANALAKIADSGSSNNAVDVTFELLNEDNALMHGEVKSPEALTMLQLGAKFYEGIGWEFSKSVCEMIYRCEPLHRVAFKRQRAKEIESIQKAAMMLFESQGMGEKKQGFLGKGFGKK